VRRPLADESVEDEAAQVFAEGDGSGSDGGDALRQ
jgi:hypothetical protein